MDSVVPTCYYLPKLTHSQSTYTLQSPIFVLVLTIGCTLKYILQFCASFGHMLGSNPRNTVTKTNTICVVMRIFPVDTSRAALQGTSTSDRAPSTNGRGDHMTTPPMPKMYKCEICSLTFTSEEGLHSHKSATHKVTNGDGVGDNTIHKNTLSASLSPKVRNLLFH